MLTLHTKDGRVVGNAIIIEKAGDTRDWGTNSKEIHPIWLVETDFGNRMKLTDREIDDWYHRGEKQLYADWRSDRDQLRSSLPAYS